MRGISIIILLFTQYHQKRIHGLFLFLKYTISDPTSHCRKKHQKIRLFNIDNRALPPWPPVIKIVNSFKRPRKLVTARSHSFS